jgi:hypothetical protein
MAYNSKTPAPDRPARPLCVLAGMAGLPRRPSAFELAGAEAVHPRSRRQHRPPAPTHQIAHRRHAGRLQAISEQGGYRRRAFAHARKNKREGVFSLANLCTENRLYVRTPIAVAETRGFPALACNDFRGVYPHSPTNWRTYDVWGGVPGIAESPILLGFCSATGELRLFPQLVGAGTGDHPPATGPT